MNVVTPAVCLHASSGGTGGAEGEGTRENDTLSGLWGPQHRAKTGAREASRKRPVGSAPRHSPSPTLSVPQVGEGLEVGTGLAGRGLGGDPSLGLAPSLSRPGGGGGGAPRPREAILAAGPRKAPAALHVSTPRSSLAPALPSGAAPRRGAGPGRAGRERPPGPASLGPGLGAAGRGPARGRRVDGIRAEERAGGKKGEGGEPLPILGRSRRRRRPAVGESKVVAGRHFGIFPQPAGHCGGHGESDPMAGGEVRWGRNAEGGKGRERGAVRSRPRRAGAGAAAASPSRLALPHSLARPGGGRRLLPGASPNPRVSPRPRVG